MKKYICKKCIAYGGKEKCVLTCEDDLSPTHCPHDDSKYPNSQWEIDAVLTPASPDSEGLCHLDNLGIPAADIKNWAESLLSEVDGLKIEDAAKKMKDELESLVRHCT